MFKAAGSNKTELGQLQVRSCSTHSRVMRLPAKWMLAAMQDLHDSSHPTPHEVQVQSCSTHPSLHVLAQCLHHVNAVQEVFGPVA